MAAKSRRSGDGSELRRAGKPTPASLAGKEETGIACPDGLDGNALFRWAMRDVRPIQRRSVRVRPVHVPRSPPGDVFEKVFASGCWQLVWTLQGDHIEAAHPSVSRTTLKRLRRGHFSVQAECDLHGMSQREAREAVAAFIEASARGRLGCVRIIHGRGNNSEGKTPVLKSGLQAWLSGRRLSRYVLAYCSALPRDGGTGAVYALLRKK